MLPVSITTKVWVLPEIRLKEGKITNFINKNNMGNTTNKKIIHDFGESSFQK